MPDAPSPSTQPRNPLHGLTLVAIVTALEAHYGWAGLAERYHQLEFAVRLWLTAQELPRL